MPVFEYECLKCGGRFDELQKFSDPPPKKHNGCGGRVKRLPSAPAIQFKGTGWYVTDYARRDSGSGDAKKTEAKAEAKAEAKPSSEKSAAQSESKPAEKATKSK
ncbi:MAG: zinc ribbon domain-containing protein [Acidobacteria bacterium]|nr:zinc ribbon domain-containing protein [Acidobacteriota bacterium]